MTKKLIGTMMYEGHEVILPITPDHKLSHPFEDYFPHNNPELWFGWNETQQNSWMRRRLGGACPIFGYPDVQNAETVEAHHIVAKGIGSKDMVKVPWAIIPSLKSFDPERSAHDLYHTYNLSGTGFAVVKWDWLDEKDGFEALDEHEEPIAHEDLFFYKRPTNGKVDEAKGWGALMLETNAQRVKALYATAILMSAGNNHAQVLGYDNVGDWMAQHGMMIQLPKKAQTLFDAFHEYWPQLEEGIVPVEMGDLVRRKVRKGLPEVKEEWVDKVLDYCSPKAKHPSIAAFITLITEAFPTSANEKKATVITGDNIKVTPRKVLDFGELFSEGIVIRGWPIGTDEAEE